MTATAGFVGPPDALEFYDAVVATNPAVARKGVAMPYTSVNGHMFSFLDASGTMALRLRAPDRDEFFATYSSTIVEQHGRVMAEYVVVPDTLLRQRAELQTWFNRSLEWVSSRKPKPTRAR